MVRPRAEQSPAPTERVQNSCHVCGFSDEKTACVIAPRVGICSLANMVKPRAEQSPAPTE
ncbi:MAG: hypothetical protein RR349_00815 [Oscillospiraceae bacterium]